MNDNENQTPAAAPNRFLPRNPYTCPKCKGMMFSEQLGRATCSGCGLRAGDFSQLTSSLDGLDVVAIRGQFRPVREVEAGLARMNAKADPGNDPLARHFRSLVEKRTREHEENEARKNSQLQSSAAAREERQELEEKLHESGMRVRRSAALKVQKLARAQFE